MRKTTKVCLETCPVGSYQRDIFCEACDRPCKSCFRHIENYCVECADGFK